MDCKKWSRVWKTAMFVANLAMVLFLTAGWSMFPNREEIIKESMERAKREGRQRMSKRIQSHWIQKSHRAPSNIGLIVKTTGAIMLIGALVHKLFGKQKKNKTVAQDAMLQMCQKSRNDSPTTPSSVHEDQGGAYCKQCGQELQEQDNFCIRCGAKISR